MIHFVKYLVCNVPPNPIVINLTMNGKRSQCQGEREESVGNKQSIQVCGLPT